MANTLSTPVLTQRKATIVNTGNASLLAAAAVHNATTPALSSTPATVFAPASTPTQVLTERQVTKFQFRQLFTLAERIAVDNASGNTALPAPARAAVVTLLKDLEVSGSVDLDLPQTIAGINFLVSVGLLTAPRGAAILANRVPA